MCLALLGVACSNNSYSKARKSEKKLIQSYVDREDLNILSEEPDYFSWGKKDFYALTNLDDNCYFHLTKPGDTTQAAVISGNECLIRYKKYTLEENPDTISTWNTNELTYPISIIYPNTAAPSCQAWAYAIMHMKYSGAECKLVCPSTVGFTADNSSVTPYIYELKLTIRRF